MVRSRKICEKMWIPSASQFRAALDANSSSECWVRTTPIRQNPTMLNPRNTMAGWHMTYCRKNAPDSVPVRNIRIKPMTMSSKPTAMSGRNTVWFLVTRSCLRMAAINFPMTWNRAAARTKPTPMANTTLRVSAIRMPILDANSKTGTRSVIARGTELRTECIAVTSFSSSLLNLGLFTTL